MSAFNVNFTKLTYDIALTEQDGKTDGNLWVCHTDSSVFVANCGM